MIQREQKLEVLVSDCRRCGRQPHYITAGDQHFLECAPCRMQTPKFLDLDQAVEAWEQGNVHQWRGVA